VAGSAPRPAAAEPADDEPNTDLEELPPDEP
jgi:hypothetical protein